MTRASRKEANEKYCSECGEVIRAKAEICPKCGVRQPGMHGAAGRSRTTAAVLALVLGGIGAHYFYLGRTVNGILCLVFCWTFLPLLDGLIHGLAWLGTTDEKWAAKWDAPAA